MSPANPDCVFGDIGLFLNAKVRSAVFSKSASMTYDQAQKIFVRSDIVDPHAHCHVHGRQCRVKRARLHVAGTECIYFSQQSPTRPGTRGPRM
eukprot:3405898-Pyramimonas_sp.AAC.1